MSEGTEKGETVKKGFTLMEMVVVVGIIGILMAALLSGFGKAPKKAERAKCQELVSNIATAMTAFFDENGAWPQRVIQNSNGTSGMDRDFAGWLKTIGVSVDTDGAERYGVVSPWAQAMLKNSKSATESSKVFGGGTVRSHRLLYAVDLDGDGIIEASVGGENVKIRATAAVWCGGADGEIEKYAAGLKKDDVYSWGYGQTQSVK